MPDIEDLKSNDIQAYYFAYFDNWDVKRNYQFIKNKIDFHKSGRSPETFTLTIV